jgi:hypothetical protein
VTLIRSCATCSACIAIAVKAHSLIELLIPARPSQTYRNKGVLRGGIAPGIGEAGREEEGVLSSIRVRSGRDACRCDDPPVLG